jgi:hypothetical protein
MSHRLNVYNKIGDLLDKCKSCPINKSPENPVVKCQDCANYAEIRRLGNMLSGPFDISVTEYK